MPETYLDIDWLKTNDYPADEVICKWAATFKDRRPCDNVNYYFTLYKCLRSTVGHILVLYNLNFVMTCPGRNENGSMVK